MSKFQIVKGITDNLEETPYIEGKVYFTYDNAESQNIVIYADIDGVRRKIKEGIQRDELDNYLLKTDIAAWAKESTKPSYTANEIGALSTSHPAATITTNQITQWNNKSNFSGSYNDLTEKPTIPTKVSDLTNDSGFLIEETDPTVHVLVLQENESGELTTGEDDSISSYVNNNELVIIYYDGKPYFYNKNSDRGYDFDGINGDYMRYYYSTTENKMVWYVYNDNSYLYYSDLPTNVSDFNNDAGYITQETDPTVPAWAKESTKPTYTAAEVGALPDTTVIPDEKLKTERVSNNDGTYYLIFGENNVTTSSTKNIDSDLRYIKSSSGDNLEIGSRSISTPRKGSITLSNGTTTGTTITPGANSQFATITLPKSTGTLALISDIPTVPENVSDLTNDSGFQTSTEVNSAIATAIGNINQFNVAIVSTLPTENIDNHTIYFMSNGGSGDSIYDEWMYINNNWEKIGTTSIDLSGYMQTSHPANGIASTDIDNWNNKADLWDIASGVGSSGNSNAFSINMNNYFGNYNTNFMVFVNKQQLINYLTQVRCTTNSEQLEIKKDNIAINGSTAGTFIEPGLYYGTLSAWSNSATLTLTKAPITSDIPTVPTNISSFTNDSGYLTSYTETDPTVPAWAKAANKPAYTATEVGAVPAFVGNAGSHSSSISSTTTSISIRQDNDSDPISSITLNTSGIELSVGGRSGNNKINLTQTGTTIHNIVTPTADMDAANKQYVDNAIPKVYSSTNTTGYLTMDTLPIYDGTVV